MLPVLEILLYLLIIFFEYYCLLLSYFLYSLLDFRKMLSFIIFEICADIIRFLIFPLWCYLIYCTKCGVSLMNEWHFYQIFVSVLTLIFWNEMTTWPPECKQSAEDVYGGCQGELRIMSSMLVLFHPPKSNILATLR